MDIKTLENSTVLFKFDECIYKVKFQYPVKRNRLHKERYSERCASSQISYILNELFTKVKEGKIVRNIQTEYFNVHVKTQEWLLGLKMQLKSERHFFNCYPKVFLLVVELKDFLIKKEVVHQPTPVNCNNFKMSPIKTKIWEKTIAGNNNNQKADVIIANNISRESSPHVSIVNTLKTFVLATPKHISEDTIRNKSLKKRCNISGILNKHDNMVKSICTPVIATPRRQYYKLTVDHFFKNGNKLCSNSEQQVARSSKHFNEKHHQKENTHLKSEEIYKSLLHTKSSQLHAVKSYPHQHSIIKQCPLYKDLCNNQASQKISKGLETAESEKKSSINSVSKIDVLERQKFCASTSQNEKKNDYNYLPINKRKRREVTNKMTELKNDHECKSRKKHTFNKMFTTGVSNSLELCSSVKSTSTSSLHKIYVNEMENIRLDCDRSVRQHFSHTKPVQVPSGLETVTIQNELTNMKLQHSLPNPEKYLESQQRQSIHRPSKAKCYKPQSTYVMSHPIQPADVLPQSANMTDGESYDSNNSCMEDVNHVPVNLYKDDVCLFRSPEVKLVMVPIARKKTF